MLGDLFYQAKGRITSKRVLDLEGPKIESSYFLEGKMREIEVVEIGTFTSIPTSGGAYFVEGNDIVTLKVVMKWSLSTDKRVVNLKIYQK